VICFREDDARLELSILISFVDILGGYNWLLGEVYEVQERGSGVYFGCGHGVVT
jgi:hypothetical protein